ncbi:emp24/gp25L/p24 family/GOLD-domain-containing protein [Circinella umbellata]|nr:emp24/gp25L/p24 family/GOLD-domain-containing protein [Circinella umbellata]
MRRACLILLAGLYWSLGCAAVKFDLPAVTPDHIEHSKRCLSQYVPKDTLVFARVNVGPGYNQRVDIEIVDDAEVPNVYTKKNGISGEITNAFDTRADAEISICFRNTLPEGFHGSPDYSRPVEVNFNVGAEAVDFETLAKKEKLGPLELELRKLETVVKEIVSELTYLKRREARMRDTNEEKRYLLYNQQMNV